MPIAKGYFSDAQKMEIGLMQVGITLTITMGSWMDGQEAMKYFN